MNIIEALQDQNLFGRLFKTPETWAAWHVYLKALFALPIDDRKERSLLKKATGLSKPPQRPVKESFVIAGRRSGKSFISAIIAVFLAAFKDWKKFLSPGERGYVFIVANDKAQARIIKNYVSGIFNSSPILQRMVENDLRESIELKNGITIAIKTASYRTLRGYTVVAAILEELAFWRSEESANPDREILAAIRPALATVSESLLIGISTPYNRSGVLYEQYKKHFGKATGPLIWKAPTRVMNPTIDEEKINEAIAEDPLAARAEWLADFREDIDSFVSLELVESAVVPLRLELPYQSQNYYLAFMDPSGGRQDSFTLAIAHQEKDDLIVLDVVRERRPPFNPEGVVKEYCELLKAYRVSGVYCDRYAGEWVRAAFTKNGIEVVWSEKSASELYLEFLPLLSSKKVELLDNKHLITQLASLERRTRSGGKDLVTHPPGGHDDIVNAVAGVSVYASNNNQRMPDVAFI